MGPARDGAHQARSCPVSIHQVWPRSCYTDFKHPSAEELAATISLGRTTRCLPEARTHRIFKPLHLLMEEVLGVVKGSSREDLRDDTTMHRPCPRKLGWHPGKKILGKKKRFYPSINGPGKTSAPGAARAVRKISALSGRRNRRKRSIPGADDDPERRNWKIFSSYEPWTERGFLEEYPVRLRKSACQRPGTEHAAVVRGARR